jgi:hypothetical protein
MKYYRNVKVDYDATVNQKEEEDDEFSLSVGGFDLPVPIIDVPGVDTDEGYDEAEETLDELSLETEEVFDDSADLTIEDDDF